MAAAAPLLLQALYTSLLSSGGSAGGTAPADDGYVLVNTTYGTLKGKVDFEPEVPIAKFFGIPFAKPPVGALRFKPPETPDKWNGTRDALVFNNVCMQESIPSFTFSNGNSTPSHSEDCLYLNVYVPTKNSNQLPLPVMVWIHGGAYWFGSGSQYDGTTLATKGVILVTINYRLDLFGFMSTEDDNMPGNYGMLDQIAALEWVQQNIAAFGGDPKRVTIFGESAGSFSVSLQILSPLAKGLFQRGIMESGVSLSPVASALPINRVSHRMLARLMGAAAQCEDLDNTTQLFFCLQQKEADMLINISILLRHALEAGLIWVPRVETAFGFLPSLPATLLSRGEFSHVDTIRGFNTDEMGNAMTQYTDTDVISSRDSAVQIIRGQLVQLTQLDQEKYTEIFVHEYLSSTNNTNILRQETVDAADDFIFVGSTLTELQDFVPKVTDKKHFLYEFNHRPSFSKAPKWTSAVHGDELFFVFGVQQKEFENSGYGPPDAEDIAVSNQMLEMWTNFAKTGDPSLTTKSPGSAAWKPYSLGSPNYLQIRPKSQVKPWPRPQAASFYRKIIQDFSGIQVPADSVIG